MGCNVDLHQTTEHSVDTHASLCTRDHTLQVHPLLLQQISKLPFNIRSSHGVPLFARVLCDVSRGDTSFSTNTLLARKYATDPHDAATPTVTPKSSSLSRLLFHWLGVSLRLLRSPKVLPPEIVGLCRKYLGFSKSCGVFLLRHHVDIIIHVATRSFQCDLATNTQVDKSGVTLIRQDTAQVQ